MKRGLLLFIILIMMISVSGLASCGTQQEETLPNYSEYGDDGTLNLDGRTFVFAQDKIDDVDSVLGYTRDSIYSDMAEARIKSIENEINCKISLTMSLGLGGSVQTALMSNFSAGLIPCELVYFGSDNANMRAAQAGVLYPLDDLLDLSNYGKFGTPNVLECCMANGSTYGVIAASWPQKPLEGNMTSVFIIDENLIKRYNLEDPRDFYEQNIWNWSKLEEITPLFHINDGEREIKTFIGHPNYFARGFFSSYGLTFVYNDNGALKSFTENPKTLEALNWGKQYTTAYQNDFAFVDRWDSWTDLINGDCVMALNETTGIHNASEELENFGFVPFPIADGNDKGTTYTYFSTYTTTSIYLGVEDPEACATIIDMLFEPFEGYETEQDMIDFLYKTMFFDMRDAKLYMQLYKSAIYDYYGIGGTAYHAIQNRYLSASPIELLQSLEGTDSEVIEKYIIPNYAVLEAYWNSK